MVGAIEPVHDPVLAERMRDPVYAAAFDVWMLLLARRAAEIDLKRGNLSSFARRHRRSHRGKAARTA